MKSRQYRIEKLPHKGTGYRVLVTFGLLDTAYIYAGKVYPKQSDARDAAKRHAADTCVKPIILT
jgi:hypothetical protein